jgi:hypothetical protein
MHEGVRTTKHSLKNCVGATPTKTWRTGKDGFCESCHAYAAVKIDCFECHSAVREAAAATAPATSSVRALNVSHKNAGASPKGKKP